MSIEKEGAYVVGGEVLILAGPEIVREAAGDLGVGYEEVAGTELGQGLENLVETAQELSVPVVTLALVYLGFKTMFKGLEDDKGGRRGFAS